MDGRTFFNLIPADRERRRREAWLTLHRRPDAPPLPEEPERASWRARLAGHLPHPGKIWQAPWTARVAAHLPFQRITTPRVVRPTPVTVASSVRRPVATPQRVASTEKEAMSG